MPESNPNPGRLIGGLNAGAIINTPAKRFHGQGRPPIREQEVIDQLNPLIKKDKKTIDDLCLESKNLYNLVTFQSLINAAFRTQETPR